MNIYRQQLLNVIKVYLGPASERFIVRQVEFHLKKSPDDLLAEDFPKIAESTRTALSMIVNDKKIPQEAYERIIKIADPDASLE